METVHLTELEAFAQYWLNSTREQFAPSTINRRLVSIKAWAKWAGDITCLHDYVPPRAAKGQAHPLREGAEGIERLLAVCKTDDQQALVALMGYGGARISEALSSRPVHVDLHDMTIRLLGKGDKERIVPLSSKCWSGIANSYVRAMDENDRLVRYADRPARKAITRLGAAAGLSRSISSHDLRMTFGTVAFEHTKDLRVVQELLGHNSSSTTEIYTGVTMYRLREGVEW